ncbi:hypothetical protein GVX82_03485 [Patescibacteria group bacterium]|jgi:thiol-disulfide isomerase/thioredoxin|nr:hypothetical protein [Patescibacteria group bacterium]
MDWLKYLITFIITGALFGTVLYVNTWANERRAAEIRSIEENISIDILSLETQFDLLEQVSCEAIKENSVLTRQLGELAQKLEFAEGQFGVEDPEVLRLKRSYTLLLLKDYLLMKQVANKCEIEPIFLFYFYSNQGDCRDCIKQGHVLTELQQEYPRLRIYAYDYNLDLSVLDTLRSIYGLTGELPALVIDEEPIYGFQTVADIEELIPELEELAVATSTATSTATTTGATSTRGGRSD